MYLIPGTWVFVVVMGVSPKRRPYHCTSISLTLAIVKSVVHLGSQFLEAGNSVMHHLTIIPEVSTLLGRHKLSLVCYFPGVTIHTYWAWHKYLFFLSQQQGCEKYRWSQIILAPSAEQNVKWKRLCLCIYIQIFCKKTYTNVIHTRADSMISMFYIISFWRLIDCKDSSRRQIFKFTAGTLLVLVFL